VSQDTFLSWALLILRLAEVWGNVNNVYDIVIYAIGFLTRVTSQEAVIKVYGYNEELIFKCMNRERERKRDA